MITLLSLLSLSSSAFAAAPASEIVVYSARAEALIQPVLDAYEKATGTKVKLVSDSAEALIEKLKAEGKATQADVLITVDAGNLTQAASAGLLSPVKSKTLDTNVPKHLRDPEGRWFAVSQRMRTLFYNPTKLKESELSTYEALAEPKWKGRVCLRTSKKVYNQSLVAMMVFSLGEKKAEEVVKGWVANLATEVFPDDTKMLEAVAAGQCDVAIANTYYFGKMQKKNSSIAVKPFWPNQAGRGVHTNVSGAGVVAATKKRAEAIRFIEFLSQGDAQKVFAELNLEFPVSPKAELDPLVKSWGSFKTDSAPLSEVGSLQPVAVRLMDRAGYR